MVTFLSPLSLPTHRREENSGYSTLLSFFLSHFGACDGREFDLMITGCLKLGNWNDSFVHSGWRLKSQECLLEEILSLEKPGCIFHVGTRVVLLSISSM